MDNQILSLLIVPITNRIQLMLEATATQQKMLMMQNWIHWFNSEGATEKWIFRKNIVLGFPQYSTYPLTPHTIYTSTLAA